MAKKPTSKRMKNKQITRNRENGLLPKCYKYGKLDGVELFLAINNTEKNEFHTYSSREDLPWLENIQDMMKQPNAANILPEDWERRTKTRGDTHKGRPERGKTEKLVEGLMATEIPGAPSAIPTSTEKGLEIPDLPCLDLTMLRKKRVASELDLELSRCRVI